MNMGTCDVCGTKLGIINKFRYADGYICKHCYEKASRKFIETIIKKTLAEIQQICQNDIGIEKYSNFEITARIGNYILFDEKNYKICILNNRMTKKQVSSPDFYTVDEIEKCEICSIPPFTKEEIENKMQQKENDVIHSLKVCIKLKNKKETADIVFISSEARIKSYAFRQSYHFATRIQEGLNYIKTKSV